MHSKQPFVADSVHAVASILTSRQVTRAFFVVDQTAYEACGASKLLEPLLRQPVVARFTDFEPNPKMEDVERGIGLFRANQPDFLIALGGGTAIDLAKLIGSLSLQQDSPIEICQGKRTIQHRGKPLLAIPTTAGTGSEATHFAVVYIHGIKYSVAHPWLLPNFAVVDPTLTESLPQQITAATGLDAFCQAIESIWAVSATDESIGFATEAAELAWKHLEAAVNSPSRESRSAMCRASHLAGKAINITKTTAPHALSYFLTSRYGIAHGMAVAMTLSPVLAFNAEVTDQDCADPRGASAVKERIERIRKIFGAADVPQACTRIEELLSKTDCPTWSDIAQSDDLEEMVDSVNLERLSNNPRRMDRNQLLKLLKNLG